MRQLAIVTTILNAISSVGPQLLALLLLSSSDFGRFSVAYLVFALSLSITFSVLCDPWAIITKDYKFDRRSFPSALVSVSLVFALVSAVISHIILGDILLTGFSSLCVLLATYRGGARYFLVLSQDWRKVLWSDIFSILGLIGGVGLSAASALSPLYVVFASWLLSGLGGIFFGPYPVWAPRATFEWFKESRERIRPLLADSLIMESSAIGTPFILLPLLGLSGFGIYRGISNLSSPVRLLLSPIRPLIISNFRRLLSVRWILISLMVSAGFGFVVGIFLTVFRRLKIDLGVLGELSQFSIAAGVYVFGAVLLSIFPLIARGQGSGRFLLIARVSQTFLGIVVPLVGFFYGDLLGAVWGFALSTCLSGFIWLSITFWFAKWGSAN